jgi:hypothetical protein
MDNKTMTNYVSDGKKLLNTEYDNLPVINDIVDNMRVISTDKKSDEEYAIFLLALNGTVTCYVLDEYYIVGNAVGFENLVKAVEAWNNEEI